MSELQTTQRQIFRAVFEERERQDDKFPPPPRPDHSPTDWLAILAEEFGEASREAVEARWAVDRMDAWAALARLRVELVQVAAVAVAWACDVELRRPGLVWEDVPPQRPAGTSGIEVVAVAEGAEGVWQVGVACKSASLPTLDFRTIYPDGRITAVGSLESAKTLAERSDWHFRLDNPDAPANPIAYAAGNASA